MSVPASPAVAGATTPGVGSPSGSSAASSPSPPPTADGQPSQPPRKRSMVMGTSVPTSFALGSFVPIQEANWVKDEDRDRCRQCKKSFGLLRRKHHCRGCAEIFCERCSAFKLVAKGGTGTHEVLTVRSCAACFERYAAPEGEALHTVSPVPSSYSHSNSSSRRVSSSSSGSSNGRERAHSSASPTSAATVAASASSAPSATAATAAALLSASHVPPSSSTSLAARGLPFVQLVGRHAMSGAHTLLLLVFLLCFVRVLPWSTLLWLGPIILCLAIALRNATRPTHHGSAAAPLTAQQKKRL